MEKIDMLQHISHLQGVGLFHEPKAKSVKFSKVTIIYGDNGRGKTTFTTILNSLRTGNAQDIVVLSTIGGKNKPSITLQIDNEKYRFRNGAWNKTYPDIIIFNETFIAENVYVGNQIDTTHKRNLFDFALGEKGVDIRKQIEEKEKQRDDLSLKIQQINTRLERIARSVGMDTDKFQDVKVLSDENQQEYEAEILSIQQELNTARQKDEIAKEHVLKQIALPDIPWDEVKQFLSQGTKAVTANVENALRSHIKAYAMGEKGEQWLQDGWNFYLNSSDKSCPFCGQRIAQAETFVSNLEIYFDEAYQSVKNKVTEWQKRIGEKLNDSLIDEIYTTSQFNVRQLKVWESHSVEVLPLEPVEQTVGLLRDIQRSLVQAFDRKRLAPLEPVEIVHVIEKWSHLEHVVARYNDVVAQINQNIDTFKQKLAKSDQKGLMDRLESLQKTLKTRQERTLAQPLYDELDNLASQKKALQEDINNLRDQLSVHLRQEMESYQQYVNEILRDFGTNFRISGTKISHQGKNSPPKTEYAIEVFGHSISLKPKDNHLSFGKALSTGDRRSLALAFFMAKALMDNRLSEKIVVIDDPVSSFDRKRQSFTREKLLKIASKCKQFILLSHDAYFVRDFRASAYFQFGKKNVVLAELRQSSKFTVFKPDFNVDAILESPHQKNYGVLIDFYQGSLASVDLYRVIHVVRSYAEGLLVNQFPELKRHSGLGKMIHEVKTNNDDRYSHIKAKIPYYEQINAFTSRYIHAELESPPPPPPTPEEVMQYVTLVLNISWGRI